MPEIEEKAKVHDREFKELVNKIYEQEFSEENKFTEIINNAKLIPSFTYDYDTCELQIIFKSNDEVNSSKDLNDFYNNIQHKEEMQNGNITFTIFANNTMYKTILQKYVDVIHFINGKNVNKYYTKKFFNEKVLVRLNALEEIIDYTVRNEFKIMLNNEETRLFDNNIKLNYQILNKKYYCEFNLLQDISNFENIIYSRDRVYIIYKNIIYRCNKKFIKNELKILETFLKNNKNKIQLKKEEMTVFFSLIMPKIFDRTEILDVTIYNYKPEDLTIKMYLDFNEKKYITANLKFSYANQDFNPLLEEPKNVNRNVLKESMFLNKLRKSKFMYDAKKKEFVLANDDDIYRFITIGIDDYNETAIIYGTDEFNSKKMRTNKKISIGVKVDNGLLDINFNDFDFEKDELKEILQKYKIKKKYHRLKDGTFVDLENNEEIEFIDNLLSGMDISYKEIEDYIRLPINRSLYLNRLLESNTNVSVTTDEKYNQIIERISNPNKEKKEPPELSNVLRDYQKTGFKWLEVLDEYNFGGILADDMGLGKTIQILSVILEYVQNNSESRTSIVVAPSSLALNWFNETKKFAPKLKVMVINGDAIERKEKIKELNNYDLVITSYDLLKRDIDVYKELNYKFKFIIADEAQYIKNNNTKNAKAIKLIEADTKYALTGTPIENSLNELWSIFDFIMPGYLFTYKKFKQNYEMPIIREQDERVLNKLKMLIEPFVLRRTKKEVLKELPDKSTSIVNNEMTEEQEKIYLSYLAQARDELNEEIEEKGFEQTRIKILALLTRLRQICCHPSLFISNYKGESGKLNQCIELLKDGIESGHKILLFSGYTSMFEIIEKQLNKNDIKYLKLTGKTKVSERLELINEFNTNDDIKVFLISLKAGGTGINLTSADMVIHYDPWWNLSVENQATDRTHRIGQTKKVQVYKLITKNSIEEKMYDLQKRKEELIDNMLSTDTKFINKLSKEDILGLFE